jgi:hypothetical protein
MGVLTQERSRDLGADAPFQGSGEYLALVLPGDQQPQLAGPEQFGESDRYPPSWGCRGPVLPGMLHSGAGELDDPRLAVEGATRLIHPHMPVAAQTDQGEIDPAICNETPISTGSLSRVGTVDIGPQDGRCGAESIEKAMSDHDLAPTRITRREPAELVEEEELDTLQSSPHG